jgi:hypothetical protein
VLLAESIRKHQQSTWVGRVPVNISQAKTRVIDSSHVGGVRRGRWVSCKWVGNWTPRLLVTHHYGHKTFKELTIKNIALVCVELGILWVNALRTPPLAGQATYWGVILPWKGALSSGPAGQDDLTRLYVDPSIIPRFWLIKNARKVQLTVYMSQTRQYL